MFVQIPGMGCEITIRPARIRTLFPTVAESTVATVVTEGRAGKLTVGRLNELILSGKKLPGPDGKPLDPGTRVATLEN
jgi:hypothetical protein